MSYTMTFCGCCTPLRIMPPMIAYVCVKKRKHAHVGLRCFEFCFTIMPPMIAYVRVLHIRIRSSCVCYTYVFAVQGGRV
jgi:hypothetical protein